MRFLSNKEKKELQSKLPLGYEINKKDQIKEKDNIILNDEDKLLIKIDNNYYPHLKSIPENNYKSVYVDKGAIPFIAKGADLMRPGIQKIDPDFNKGEIIQIKDENMQKTIALGTPLFNSKDLEKETKGKVVEIYHYIGDKYY